MVIPFSTDIDCDKCMAGCTLCRLTASDKVGPRPADRVLDDVGQERRQRMANEQPEDGDVELVKGRAQYGGPRNDHQSRNEAGVDQVPADWHSLDQRVRVRF